MAILLVFHLHSSFLECMMKFMFVLDNICKDHLTIYLRMKMHLKFYEDKNAIEMSKYYRLTFCLFKNPIHNPTQPNQTIC